MMHIRKAMERGYVNFDWLKSYHTFSFGEYYDKNFMGFSCLRVINEDRVDEERGFSTHSHKDMEIISYVIDGELEHKDSMGNGSVIRPGDVQYMSAGSGVSHSEFNPSSTMVSHFLQIWILPDIKNAPPRYDQKHFTRESKTNRLLCIASKNGEDNSIAIRQDAKIYASVLNGKNSLTHEVQKGRAAWLQVVQGQLKIGDTTLSTSDACSTTQEETWTLSAATADCEFLLFDVPL